MKHSSVYEASSPQTRRTNGSWRKKGRRRRSTPEHGSVNADQLPGTGIRQPWFFFQVKSPKFQGVRGRVIQKGQRTLFVEPKLKCPMSCPQPREPYLNGTNHHHALRWGRGGRELAGGRTPVDCPVQNLLFAPPASYGEGLGKAHHRADDMC